MSYLKHKNLNNMKPEYKKILIYYNPVKGNSKNSMDITLEEEFLIQYCTHFHFNSPRQYALNCIYRSPQSFYQKVKRLINKKILMWDPIDKCYKMQREASRKHYALTRTQTRISKTGGTIKKVTPYLEISLELISAVRDDVDLNFNDLIILATIISYEKKKKECMESNESLADKIVKYVGEDIRKISKTTISRRIAILKRNGYLNPKDRFQVERERLRAKKKDIPFSLLRKRSLKISRDLYEELEDRRKEIEASNIYERIYSNTYRCSTYWKKHREKNWRYFRRA